MKSTKSRRICSSPVFIGEINIFNATVIERLDEQRVRACVEGRECNIYVNFAVEKGQQLNVLLRPEDLRVDEIHHGSEADGLIGYVRERNYKGMTLESVVELEKRQDGYGQRILQ